MEVAVLDFECFAGPGTLQKTVVEKNWYQNNGPLSSPFILHGLWKWNRRYLES
jgi:hypothetical protein